MASIKVHPKGGYRVHIFKAGVRKTQVFPTKKEAADWATKTEAEILAGLTGMYPKKTLADACEEYVAKVSSKKAGEAWERSRLNAFRRDYPTLAAKQLTKITTGDLANWRDDRLKTVTGGTVERDITLLGHIFTVARKEWRWCGESPFANLKSPGQNAPRTARIRWQDVRAMCRKLNYVTGEVETKSQEIALAFLISLRTALRAGEVLSLTDRDLNLQTRVLVLNTHKTIRHTKRARRVPFTKKACRLFSYVSGRGRLFTVKGDSMATMFADARERCGLEGFTYHDSRAEALTRLSKRVDVQTLQKISGHTDINMLTKHYYRETEEDIAARL